MRPNTVAIIEDDPTMCGLLDDLLTEEGYQTQIWPPGSDVGTWIRREQPDLVILDLWLSSHGDGSEILQQLRTNGATAGIPVIVCTGAALSPHEEAVILGDPHCALVAKPFDLEALLTAAHGLVRQSATRQQTNHSAVA